MIFQIGNVPVEEQPLLFSTEQEIMKNSGCVGYLRGDFDGNRTNFYTSWFDVNENIKTDLFKTELNKVINALRNDSTYPVLKSREAMLGFCSKNADSKLDPSLRKDSFGFRLDTEKYQFYLRCFPYEGDYNFYCYAYDKEILQEHLSHKNSPEKHIIWSNHNLDFEKWKAELKEEYPHMTENDLISQMYETNNNYLDDERINLNIQMPRDILVIADIGRWNGRFSGYAEIKSGNIKDCLYSECDYTEWFVDKSGDFRCDAYHHDGVNHYLYRALRDGASDVQIERLKDLIYCNKVTDKDIKAVTERLGDKIGEVYGWAFKPEQQEKMVRKMEYER